MDASAYRDQLAALLPRGLPWPRDPGAVLQRLLLAWADSLARVDARAVDLLAEADPRYASEMLGEWERAHGLPDPCLGAADTDAARRAALLARITDAGGQTPAYYIALAESLGVSVVLTEYRPHCVDDGVDTPLRGRDWAYAWQIHAAETASYDLAVDDGVDQPLAGWVGLGGLECLLRRLKPAHTHLIFSYGG